MSWNLVGQAAKLGGMVAALGFLAAACGGAESTATPAPTAPATTPPASTAAPSPARTLAAPTATPVPQPTATPPGPTPKYGGIFRMRISGAYADLWDNYSPAGGSAVIITQNLLSNLTVLDSIDGLTLRPDLAESWTISPGGKSITYRLRKDARWHDDRPFTAKDALYSLNRAKSPVDPKASLHVAGMKIVDNFTSADEYSVTANLSAPSASFLLKMSSPNMLIYPAHVPVDQSPGWLDNRVGTGPFKFKEHRPSVISELIRFQGYFKKDAAGRALPYLDGVRHIWIPDRALTIAAFRTGELDCACGYTSDIVAMDKEGVVKSIPNARFGTTASSMGYIIFNSKPPYDNQKVRQAVSASINRKEATDLYRLGTGVYPPTYFVPADYGGKLSLPTREWLDTPGFRVKDGKKDPADLALAKKLWCEAGLDPANVNMKLLGTTGGLGDYAELVAAVMGEIGVKLNFQYVDSPVRTTTEARGDFDVDIQPGSNSFEDPSDILLPRITTGGGLNWGKWSNPRVDELSAAQERELDAAKRQQLIVDLQRVLLDWAVILPFSNLPALYAVQPYVEGFPLNRAFSTSSAHRLENVWLNK